MQPVRFLHTSDWQLGMRRHFLTEEALPRYMQARIDAIVAIGRLAGERECEFVGVCGDVFESNQVDRRTVGRALEALAAVPCRVFLLPGNHDPYDIGSIYRAASFHPPGNVTVLTSTDPIEVRPGLEVAGAPWVSKRPGRDPVGEACEKLEPFTGTRILLGHGAALFPKPQIDVDAVRRAIAEKRFAFLALGDRHSYTEVADRIWYSGSPEPTDFDETEPGFVLCVEIDRGGDCRVEPLAVAEWRFVRRPFELGGEEDVAALDEWLRGIERKQNTIVRLDIEGQLTLNDHARFQAALEEARELYAALETRDKVALRPDQLELADLGLSGFARAAAQTLAQQETDEVARDALALLHRLAR